MIALFVASLLVVPTELTEYTEAYGVKLFETTERIDAARHTTESTLTRLRADNFLSGLCNYVDEDLNDL